MLWKRALILKFCFILVLGSPPFPVDKSDSIQNRITRNEEINNINSQTDIQNDRAERSKENERNDTEKEKVYEVQNPEKDLDKVSESPSKFLYSRKLPTKPIETIVIENPPHLSVAVKNLDIAKRLRRSSTIISIIPINNDNEGRLSIERQKRHLPILQVELDPQIYEGLEKYSDERYKRHLQNFPVQYEDIDNKQTPQLYKVIYRTRERSKRYPQRFVLGSNVDEARTKGVILNIPRTEHERTAEPFNLEGDSSEQTPSRNFKAEELANESTKTAEPFNEPARPVGPSNPVEPDFAGPAKPKPVDYRLDKPTAAKGSLRGLGLPPTIPSGPYPARHANCIQCTNKYHNHDPQVGQYHGQSIPRYGNVEMLPFIHSYYPAGNLYVNRRFGVSQHPTQREDPGFVEYRYASNDRNEYPLAEPEP